MKTSNRNGIGTICRTLVVTGLTVAALGLRADEKDSLEPKGGPASAQGGPASAQYGKAGDTQTCIKEAAKMNMATIKLAQLASQRAENPELKRFAQQLEQDHKKSQTDLQQLAGKHNVTLPTELDEKCKQEISKLEQLSGREFDREFAKGAVEGHAMAIAHLEEATSQAKDADLRQHTQKTLAQVKEHQRQAREVAKTVGVDQATITSLESKAKEGLGAPAAGTEGSNSQDSEKKQP